MNNWLNLGSHLLRGALHNEKLSVKGAWLCILNLLCEKDSPDGKIGVAKGKGYSDSWFSEEFGCTRQEWNYCKKRLQEIGLIKISSSGEIIVNLVKNLEKNQEKNNEVSESASSIEGHSEASPQIKGSEKQLPLSELSSDQGGSYDGFLLNEGGSCDDLPVLEGVKTEGSKKQFPPLEAEKTPLRLNGNGLSCLAGLGSGEERKESKEERKQKEDERKKKEESSKEERKKKEEERVKKEETRGKKEDYYANSENCANRDLKKELEEKKAYAEFVFLTEKEYQSLITRWGSEDKVKRGIEILNAYKGANGKKYKSDYFACISWVEDRLKKEEQKRQESVPRGIAGLREFMEEARDD